VVHARNERMNEYTFKGRKGRGELRAGKGRREGKEKGGIPCQFFFFQLLALY